MDKQGPHARNLRRGRHSEPGRIYHVTAATRDRLPVFADLHNARLLIGILRELQARDIAESLCFVVMPDHLHWLFRLNQTRELTATVASLKSISAHRLGRRLWQRGFHERAIRREEDLQAIARYMLANPLRAGLVTRVGDYPHWDAIWL